MTIELENTINDENIERLVRTFYPSVLEDVLVGPFFIEKLGSDISSAQWEQHLVLLSQFWAFAALGDGVYTGHPLAPHFEIEGISREAFKQWLTLFYDAVDKTYTEKIGEFFKTKSAEIAENFMRQLEV